MEITWSPQVGSPDASLGTADQYPSVIETTPPDVLERIWARRAAQLAAVPVQEDEGTKMGLVLVRLGHEVFGLEVEYVSQIKPLERITKVPRVPGWVAGVVNLQGRILSVLDPQRLFGLPRAEDSEGNGEAIPSHDLRTLVVVEAQGQETVLLTDEVLAVAELPASQLHSNHRTALGIPPEYVQGVINCKSPDLMLDGSEAPVLVTVLDLQALLTDEKLIICEDIK